MNENIQNGQDMQVALDTASVNRKGIKAYTRYGLAILAFLLIPQVLISVIYMIANTISPGITFASAFWGMPLSYICMYLIAFPIMLLILKGVPKNTAAMQGVAPKKMKPWALVGLYFICFTTMNVLATIVNFIEAALGSSATVTTEQLASGSLPQWALFLMGVIVAPVMEEVIFRLIGYNKVSGYGAGIYIVWTAIMFGLLHLNLGQAIYATAIGLILAKVTYDTGTAKYSIILHILVNFTGGVGIGSFVIRTGNEGLLIGYSVLIYAIMLVGIICAIIFFVKYRTHLKCAAVAAPMTNKKMAFLNVGTILYVVVSLGTIVYGIVSTMGAA